MGRAVARALRAIPPGPCFAAALTIARAAAPILVRVRAATRLGASRLDEPIATALFVVLGYLHAKKTRFNVPFRVEGDVSLTVPGNTRAGILVAAPASALNTLLARFVYEHHSEPLVVAAELDSYPILGTATSIPCLRISPTYMLTVRTALAQNRVVLAMVEQTRSSRRTVDFDTTRGRVFVADSLIRLASHCGARICFATNHLGHNGEVVITLESPQPAGTRTADSDVAAFVSFMQRHIAARQAA